MKHIGEFLDEILEEMFEERAGIREFDGQEQRSAAEQAARREVEAWKQNRERAA